MKLRVKDRHQLERILTEMKEAQAFLLHDDTAVMCATRMGSADVFTAAYYPEKRYQSIDKQIGSKLCHLWTAIETFEKALAA